MPIYEYLCDACGHQLAKLQKLNDIPLVECPSCQQATLKKQMSVAGFQLKGTGWYATDYKPKRAKDDQATLMASCPVARACGAQCNGTTSAK